MSTFSPVISPWIAAGSCVGFTVLFVGSLYVFPLKAKQEQREHAARYSLLSSISQSTPVSVSASALAVVAAAAAGASGAASSSSSLNTPPASPRPSSSSTISTATFIGTAASTSGPTGGEGAGRGSGSFNSITTASITTTTTTTTSSSVLPKKSQSTGIADNRAHRSSTHLHFNESTGVIIPLKSQSTGISADNRAHRTSAHLHLMESGVVGTVGSAGGLAGNISSPVSSPAPSTTSTFTISASTSASSTSGLGSSGPLTAARPEVAIHSYAYSSSSSSSQFDHHNRALSHSLHSPVDKKLDRDHPLVIVQRFKGILLTCFLVPLYLWWLFKFTGAISSDISFWTRLGDFLGLLGISFPESIFKLANHIVVPLFLVGILFMGPILMMFLSNELPFQQAFDWASQRQYFRNLIGIRNFVVGPISEEFIFRACMVAIVAYSGASPYSMVFGLPLVFGIAHIHHAYEAYTKKGRTRRALLNAAMMALFQLIYTTLFGWFATFLFLRTSNLIGPCLCHTFCNMMGFPDVTNIQYYGRWKNWLYLTFLTGVVLFGLLLRPLTNPELYGNEVSSAYWRITMGEIKAQS